MFCCHEAAPASYIITHVQGTCAAKILNSTALYEVPTDVPTIVCIRGGRLASWVLAVSIRFDRLSTSVTLQASARNAIVACEHFKSTLEQWRVFCEANRTGWVHEKAASTRAQVPHTSGPSGVYTVHAIYSAQPCNYSSWNQSLALHFCSHAGTLARIRLAAPVPGLSGVPY
jgi:hypothetical protein